MSLNAVYKLVHFNYTLTCSEMKYIVADTE